MPVSSPFHLSENSPASIWLDLVGFGWKNPLYCHLLENCDNKMQSRLSALWTAAPAGQGEALASGRLPTGEAEKGPGAPAGSPLPRRSVLSLHTRPPAAFRNRLDLGLPGGRGKTVLPLQCLKNTPNKENKKWTLRYKGHASLGLDPQSEGWLRERSVPVTDKSV